MIEERYVVVEHGPGRRRALERVYNTEPVALHVALDRADHRRDIAAARGSRATYRVCELVDVGHGGGTPAGDRQQAKAALQSHFGVSEPTAHKLIQRLAMELRVDTHRAALLVLRGITAALPPGTAPPADQAVPAGADGG